MIPNFPPFTTGTTLSVALSTYRNFFGGVPSIIAKEVIRDGLRVGIPKAIGLEWSIKKKKRQRNLKGFGKSSCHPPFVSGLSFKSIVITAWSS